MWWGSWPGQLKPSGAYTLCAKKEYPNFHLNMNGLDFSEIWKGSAGYFCFKIIKFVQCMERKNNRHYSFHMQKFFNE